MSGFIYYYAEYRYAKCRYAECRGAENVFDTDAWGYFAAGERFIASVLADRELKKVINNS